MEWVALSHKSRFVELMEVVTSCHSHRVTAHSNVYVVLTTSNNVGNTDRNSNLDGYLQVRVAIIFLRIGDVYNMLTGTTYTCLQKKRIVAIS
jgi:hypothetical protein